MTSTSTKWVLLNKKLNMFYGEHTGYENSLSKAAFFDTRSDARYFSNADERPVKVTITLTVDV